MRDARFRLLVLGFLALLTAAVWLFPSWYPVLNPNTISIAYPGLELEAQADYALLPEAMRDAYEDLRRGDEDENRPPRPDAALALVRARLLGVDFVAPDEMQAQPLPAEARTLRTGTFIQQSPINGATGGLIIYQTPDLRRFLRLQDEFSVTRAPDIHIIFTRNPDPYDINGVGVDYIDVGPLQYNVGTQTYEVPTDVNFAQYPIVALYSPTIDYVLSTATLR